MDDKYSNKAVAHLLKSMAAAYIILNEKSKSKQNNNFRIIAYDRAADTIEHLNSEVKDIWEQGKLKEIAGIGASISSYLDEYFRKGNVKHFEEITKNIPQSVFELMKVRSIGPKKSLKLVSSLKLNNAKTVIEDLKNAIAKDKVSAIPSFGKKSQQDILEAIKLYQKNQSVKERMPLPYAYNLASEVIAYLKKHPKILRADILGSLRRMTATIGDIDIAVGINSYQDAKTVVDYFTQYPKAYKIENKGDKKATIIIKPNINIDLRLQEIADYGAMLQYFTGSKAHNINLREYAIRKGLSLSEYGIKILNAKSPQEFLRNSAGQAKIKFENEEKLYQYLGLQHIPPEIREGTDEIELAAKKQLPDLVTLKDIKGDLHIHSSYDIKPSHDLGINSYQEILTKAKKLGYQYIGFTDHNSKYSQTDFDVINSIMKARKEYIDQTFCSNKIDHSNYFIGIEVDILPNGKIALPNDSFKYLDYIIVAVHSSLNMNKKDMTKRILEALKYPKVKILAHPTGKLFGKREAYELEWDKIFEACRNNNICLEINSWPLRLDLSDILVREAINNGVKLVINSDAHENKEMDNMFYGVAVARRGWAKKSDIINTYSYDKIKQWIRSEK